MKKFAICGIAAIAGIPLPGVGQTGGEGNTGRGAEAAPAERHFAGARELMAALCFSCHRTQPSHEEQEKGLAPPMWGGATTI